MVDEKVGHFGCGSKELRLNRIVVSREGFCVAWSIIASKEFRVLYTPPRDHPTSPPFQLWGPWRRFQDVILR
jgi:hypothetical protein